MNKESSPVIVVFGENAKFGQGRKFLEKQPDHMGPITRISSSASGIIARRFTESEIWYVGCDPFKTGEEESVQMEAYALTQFPEIEGRTRTFTGFRDTSLQVEVISEELNRNNSNNQIRAILPLEHERRASGQLKAFDASLKKVHLAHKVYILDPEISDETRLERIEEIRRIYFTVGMYFDIMREFGLNLIGKIDNKGLLVRQISEKFR